MAHRILGGEAQVTLVRDDVSARVDALVPDGELLIVRETKASTHSKSHYLEDIAIQAWVAEADRRISKRVELNLLDNEWRYPGDDDYRGLFRQVDVTESIADMKSEVPNWVEHARQVVAGEMPAVITGEQCGKPYGCPFLGFCAGLEPPPTAHPIELLPGAGKRLARKLREAKGYVSLLEPQPDEFVGKDRDLYLRMQQAHRDGHEILDPKTTEVMANFPYPRHFLDFEGIDFRYRDGKEHVPTSRCPFNGRATPSVHRGYSATASSWT